MSEKVRRVQLDAMILDVDFFEKPKIIALCHKFSRCHAAWLINAYMQMSRATDACVDFDTLEALAFQWSMKDFEPTLAYCIEKKLIIKRPDGYSNSRVEEDQEACALKQEKWRTNKRQQRESSKSPNGVQEDSTRTSEGVHEDSLRSPQSVRILNTEHRRLNTEDPKEGGAGETNGHSPPHKTLFNLTAFWTEAELESLKKLEAMHFDEPGDQPWTKTSVFMNTGKRPMKKYPLIWITPVHLFEVNKILHQKLPPSHHREVFLKCHSKVESAVGKGRRPEDVDSQSWLTSFCLTEVLNQLNEEVKINKNAARANG